MSNSGFIVNGGQINVTGGMAVGKGAQVNVQADSRARDVSDKLDLLLSEIRAGQLSADERRSLSRAVDEVKQEAERPQPDKGFMMQTLSKIERTVSSVSGIATAAVAVKTALALLLP